VLRNPQSGYLNTRGLNAQDAFEPTAQALSKARQDARSTLTNPIQQRMFDQATNDRMFAIGRQMGDHQHQQVTQYGIQQSQDHADAMALQARDAYLGGRLDDYQRASNSIAADVVKVGELNGASADSDVTKAMLRAKRTELVQGITLALRDAHKFEEMKQFFDDHSGEIDMRAAETLGSFVKSEYDRNASEKRVEDRFAAVQSGGATPYTYGPLATGSTINPMKITDVPGSPRPGGRTHDGYDIAMKTGTPVTAPLDGKVVKVWNDEQNGGGLSMRVQLADGNTLGVAHLSQQNVKEGDTVNRGQVIALSGKTGNATGPVLHVALMDPDGKHVDYFGASKPQPDQANMADPNVLQRVIDLTNADSSLDPYQKKQDIRYAESLHSHQRAIQAQQYQEVKQGAVDWYYSHGQSIADMPAAEKAQLKPEDAFNLSQPASVETDPETMANFILDPKSVTVANVKDAYASKKLNNGSYFSLLREAMDNANDPSKVMEATVEADRLKFFADQAGIPGIYKTAAGDAGIQQKRDYASLLVRVQQEIDQAQQQKQGKLSQDEKDKIIQRNVQQHVITHLRSAWNPLAIFGNKTYQTAYRQFQVPQGATSTVMGSDGKLHFTDGKKDLGPVPESEPSKTAGAGEDSE
jgi:murein DD-endopeptidase MepM/ murein hydrolase activator NlpD